VASSMYLPSVSRNMSLPLAQTSDMHVKDSFAATAGAALFAMSVEFVAKPGEAQLLESELPSSIIAALKDAPGFAGCLVMVSDQEARLATVVTFWAGADRRRRCGESERWVRALLAPYLDRRLRVQTMIAHSPLSLASQPETEGCFERSGKQDLPCEEGNVCVA